MNDRIYRRFTELFILLIVFTLLTACRGTPPVPTIETSVEAVTSSPSETAIVSTPSPVKPTATAVPLAALVNGEPITMEEFQNELSQFLAVHDESGTNLATDAEKFVLDDMINQVLLAQAAYESGYYIDESDLQSRMDELAEVIGGTQELINWYTEHGYTEPGFRIALARSVAAAWMRDHIISEVPETAEQVHARQILLYNEEQANEVYDLLQSGQDFESLAINNDPVTGGDLGWITRGYLTQAAVEEAAFRLEPGEYSQVIKTDLGYHIVQVVENDPQRKLDLDAYAILQTQAIKLWLEARRGESEVQILLP